MNEPGVHVLRFFPLRKPVWSARRSVLLTFQLVEAENHRITSIAIPQMTFNRNATEIPIMSPRANIEWAIFW